MPAFPPWTWKIMRGSQCLFSPAAALRKVFINNALAPGCHGQLDLPQLLVPSSISPQLRSSFSTQRALLIRYGKNQSEKPGTDKTPRDFSIRSPFVHVRNDDTGRLSEPQRTKDLLRSLDLDSESLVVIADPTKKKGKGNEDGNEVGEEDLDPNTPRYPICRIVDKRAEMAIQLAKNKELRKSKVMVKEIELNWAIAPNDLNTRLKQLKGFLNKGFRVQVLLLKKAKRGKRTASDEEAKALLATVKEFIEQVPETKEVKPIEGFVGKQIKLTLQGTKVTAAPADD
ncbi:hypothetical protein B0H67DRAFT_576154 [Lasiosphaeris hirsuta]|uniref:Translation initiation factor 3 C-terminal domain-containing protein n=1 Tax=Lasiosphaeris hirsuta TaxID=260670 RepID=A0AA40E161_9PEZI|nr:hypothetical protein B0H67DRAFT_576154 [Lasiosphaeris hirsuta]